MRHDGKRVLVTGGASGIGYAIANRFLAEGASVVILDLNEASVTQSAERLSSVGPAHGRTGSVTEEEDVQGVVDFMRSDLGGVDCLVNSAGVVKVEPALEHPTADFRRIIDVNVTGTWIASQACARVMSDNGGGSIVNMGSVYGLGGAPQRTAYCASKAAIVGLTQSLAVEWGPLGIRVNAVAPTGTRTPMVQDLIDRGIYDLDGVQRKTPLGRLAEPEEVAAACSFLASDDAAMVTGHHLPVDGGWLANNYVT